MATLSAGYAEIGNAEQRKTVTLLRVDTKERILNGEFTLDTEFRVCYDELSSDLVFEIMNESSGVSMCGYIDTEGKINWL
jgi:hypothetical protein